MKKYFEKLQEKPEAHRKKLASIFAGVVTFVILILWLLILAFTKHYFPKGQSGMEQFDELIYKISEQSDQFNKVTEEKDKLSSCASKALDSIEQEEKKPQNDNQVHTEVQEGCSTDDTQKAQLSEVSQEESSDGQITSEAE